jgi:type II secretory pathway component PulM
MNRDRESTYPFPARAVRVASGTFASMLLRAFRHPLVAVQWTAASLRARWTRASPFARDISLVLVLKVVLLVMLWAAFFRGPAVPHTADAKAGLATKRLLGADPAPVSSHADR